MGRYVGGKVILDQVMSSHHSDQKSLGLLFNVEIKRCLTHSVSESVSDKVTY